MSKIIAALACALLLALPAAAFAQSGVSGYEDSGSQVAGAVQSGGGGGGTPATTAQANDTGGTLPFTGAELGVLAGAGGLLVLLGFSLRRLTHQPSKA